MSEDKETDAEVVSINCTGRLSSCNESWISYDSSNSRNNSNLSPNGYNFYKTQQLVFLCVLFVFIVVSNILIIVAILCSSERKSRMNFFIVHLAIADLSMGLIVVLSDIVWKSTVEWHGGNAGCKIVKYLQSAATFASTYVLVALSIDRVKAIVLPLTTGSGRSRRFLILGAWLTALIFSIPLLILPQETIRNNIRQCHIQFSEQWYWKPYISVLTALVFIAPAVIIAICYTIIIVVVWNKSSMTTGSMAAKTTVTRPSIIKRRRGVPSLQYSMRRAFAADTETQRRLETRSSSRGVIPKAKIKTIKMTLVIVIAFILCWSPFIIYNLLDVYGLIPRAHRKNALSIFIQSLVPLNSAANPIIFCLFSTRECKTRRSKSFLRTKFLNCFCCWRRGATPSGCRNGGAVPHSTFSSLTVYTGPGAVDRYELPPAARVNRRPRVGVVVSGGGSGGGGGAGARRHSSTPYVKGSLNAIESEILLKHICRQRLGDQRSDEVTAESG